MKTNVSRRNWLKSGLVVTTGALALPGQLRAENQGFVNAPDAFSTIYWERQQELLQQARLATAPQIKARLSANENPWGPSAKAKSALTQAADTAYLYAMPVMMELRKHIADSVGLSEDHILMGAGSSELLMASLLNYGSKGTVLMGDPCYISNREGREEASMPTDKVPLTKAYQYDLNALSDHINGKTSLIYICNPNNPTGQILPADVLRSFCGSQSSVPVLVDEAYIDYAKDPKTETMLDCVQKGQNVLILRTLSKLHAFAGLRIGYAIGQPDTLKELRKFSSGGFSISGPSAAAAIASMKDTDFQQMTLKNTLESKQFLYDFLKQSGYTYLPSSSNFVLFPLRMKGIPFVERMLAEGVSIRRWEFDNQHWCRVSIGKLDEMKAFATAFQKVVS